jgi:hypothetical protein
MQTANSRLQPLQGEELEITSIGYQNDTVVAGADKNINVVLLTAANALSDVVVIGYGTQLKRQVTGSLASVDMAEAKKFATSDINNMLQGRVAGRCCKK